MARKDVWPTPTKSNGDPRRGMPSQATAALRYLSGKRNLDDAVALWPTPLASRGGSRLRASEEWATPTVKGNHNKKGLSPSSGDGLSTQVGGALNPTWVEWLMGYPSEWTALPAWAMPLSQRKRAAHSKSSQG